MKIYVIEEIFDYESGKAIAIFSSKDKADKYLNKIKRDIKDYNDRYIKEYPNSFNDPNFIIIDYEDGSGFHIGYHCFNIKILELDKQYQYQY